MNPVYITRLSSFLPNNPVSNEEMEEILGKVNDVPSRARLKVLRNNGIQQRYYTIKDGQHTHTNTEMAATAVRALFDGRKPIEQLQLLTTGTSSPEQLLPSHAAMVHGELASQPVEILSSSGACCSSIQGLKYAWMSIASGDKQMAASVGSERNSSWLHARRFQPEADSWKEIDGNPYIAFEKDFLRWMLSDGAGAALLENKPDEEGPSLRIEWIEIRSYANELETCMYAGAVKNEQGKLTGWNDLSAEEWNAASVFSYKQDTRMLGEHIIRKGGDFLAELAQKHGLTADGIDWFLPHMSSMFFKKQIDTDLKRIGLDIPEERYFYNLREVGNVGSASPFLMLEALMRSGRAKKGDRILVMVPESARFTYAYLYLTVV